MEKLKVKGSSGTLGIRGSRRSSKPIDVYGNNTGNGHGLHSSNSLGANPNASAATKCTCASAIGRVQRFGVVTVHVTVNNNIRLILTQQIGKHRRFGLKVARRVVQHHDERSRSR